MRKEARINGTTAEDNLHKDPYILSPDIIKFAWGTLRQTESDLINYHLVPYALEVVPPEAISHILSQLQFEQLPNEVNKSLLFSCFVVPWLLFNWVPGHSFSGPLFKGQKTIIQNYVEHTKNPLNAAQIDFITQMKNSYYSFYRIKEIEPQRHLIMYDILLDTIHTVKEYEATHYLKPHDIVFGRLLTEDRYAIFVGIAPFIIPSPYIADILAFKEELMIQSQQLLDKSLLRTILDCDLIEYFLALLDDLFSFNSKKIRHASRPCELGV